MPFSVEQFKAVTNQNNANWFENSCNYLNSIPTLNETEFENVFYVLFSGGFKEKELTHLGSLTKPKYVGSAKAFALVTAGRARAYEERDYKKFVSVFGNQ
jgi:hypothetical protein